MTKTIFIATAESYSGKFIVALGLVNMLLGKTKKVGYFKPIINPDPNERKDSHIETIVDYFGLNIPYADTYAFTRQEALHHIETKTQGEMIDTIINKFKAMEEKYDFTVIEGSDFVGEGLAFEFDSNLSIAKNLSAPVIIVISGERRTTAQVVNSAITVFHNFDAREVQVIAIVINKVNPEQSEDIRELLKAQLEERIILAIIPQEKSLKSPTMKEIYENLGGKLLFGKDSLSNQVDNFVTGAMQVPNFLNFLKENVLIVTPGDRGDIIICALQANLSTSYPKVAGIVLTAGTEPEDPIIRLIEGSQSVFPIIAVPTGTFETTTKIGAIQSKITSDNKKKVELAIDIFEKYVDIKALDEKMVTYEAEGITPHMFQYKLIKWAKSSIKHIVLPEGNDDRILKAAARLINHEVVQLTILGDPTEIAASIKRLGLTFDTSKLRILNPVHSEYYHDYVETLYELRKNKNVTLEMARDL